MNRKVVMLASLLVIGLTVGAPVPAEAAALCQPQPGGVCNPLIPFPCCDTALICTEKPGPAPYWICEAVD